jgi:cysteine desulfuration protein SufE
MMPTTTTIQDRADSVVEEFSYFDDWLGRYEYLIELGKQLPLIDAQYKTDEYRIKGCQSQVWLKPSVNDGLLHFEADSDALITKGLVALLVRVLDGESPADILDADLSFLDRIGMNEHLSPTRKNGLSAMVAKIRNYAKAVETTGQLPGPSDDEALAGSDNARRAQAPGEPASAGEIQSIRENVIDALKLVYDPEIPVNVYDMGLIYDVFVYPDRTVKIRMTLTTPNCPAAGILPSQVETRAANVEGVSEARVELTFDPPYSIALMSDAAKLELGLL